MVDRYILIVLFAILALVFFRGKGGWLIAGYNAMSSEEKEKYNYKRLCHIMGSCMIATDVLLIISCLIGETAADNLENVFTILGIAVVIITILLVNTICRKK